MSTKWYDAHLQEIIRENQMLKCQANRTLSTQVIHQEIAACFAELFSDIPPLVVSHRSQICIIQQLQYYRKTVGKWLEKERAKMQFLMGQNQCEQQSQQISSTAQSQSDGQKNSASNFYKLTEQQSGTNQLEVRIQQLQFQVQQLRTEMTQLQKQQQKYLGQISYLRSITKKLQYELAEQMMVEQKLKGVMLVESKKLQKELEPLKTEVLIWKGQYDRLWHQNQKMKRVKSSHQKFEQEITLLNTSCKDDRQESNHSQLWVIRGEQFQQSYVVDAFEDNEDRSESSFTNSEKH